MPVLFRNSIVTDEATGNPQSIQQRASQLGLRVVDGTVKPPPPHNLPLEQAILGLLLMENSIAAKFAFLQPHHFFEPLHQQIYETALKLVADGKPANPITLRTFFERHQAINPDMSVPQYLGTLAGAATTVFNAEAYAKELCELGARRTAIVLSEALAEAAYSPRVDRPFSADVGAAISAFDTLRREHNVAGDNEGLLFAGGKTCNSPLGYYIKALIPADSIIAVYGATTVGKSFWVCDALWHVAAGMPSFCGRRIKRAPVLYIGLEGRAGIPNRMAALQRQYGNEAWFACLMLPVSLGTAEQNAADEALVIQKATAVAKHYGQPVGAIVVDTLAQAVAGDNENEAATVAAFLARCQRIKAATGATIVFTAHPGKNAALGIRGSSALSPALDTVIRIEREEGASLRTVTLEKVKDGVEGPFGSFTLKQVELGTDADGDPITSCVVEHGNTDEGVSAKWRKMPKPGSPAELCLEEINELVIAGHGRRIDHERIPDGVVCVDLEEWRSACYLKNICSSDSQDARRQAFFRAFKQLERMSLITSHDQHVWKIAENTGVTTPKSAEHADLSDE
jgi:hypothetical protein